MQKHEPELQRIFQNVKLWQIEEDIKREQYLEVKRQKKMSKKKAIASISGVPISHMNEITKVEDKPNLNMLE